MNGRKKAESGFTLLELLISLAVVAVIVTFCLLAVRLAVASREAGTQKADIQQRLRVLHEHLNSTLRSANLIFVPNESQSLLPDDSKEKFSDSRILAFEGLPESLRFVTFSETLMGERNSAWMHEVHFYLQKNEDTGMMEILLNERKFSPTNFFKHGSDGLETGQTLRISHNVAYLKFRYYYEISEMGIFNEASGEKSIKVSGEWTDKIITEPFDFKSNIGDNKSIDKQQDAIPLPRAVEFSVGLWELGSPEEDESPQAVELPPILIPIQTGMVFDRLAKGKEESVAPPK
ncbi:MAG: type II secretion system GspH family protein [Nitrospinota bacterium]|nr:type II secretion system GspH family protein [Nitrospinota bacterium]